MTNVAEQQTHRNCWRHQLRLQNINAISGVNINSYSNDPNLKKNTAFINKCKAGLTHESAPQLLQGIKTLKLEKYISEIVFAVLEGVIHKTKSSADFQAACTTISALHQRFPRTFTPSFNESLLRNLIPPSKAHLATLPADQRLKEEVARIHKQRILLRLAGDLWLVGVLRNEGDGKASTPNDTVAGLMTPGGGANGNAVELSGLTHSERRREARGETLTQGPVLYSTLQDLLASERNVQATIPLAATFVKHFGEDILGVTYRKTLSTRARASNEENTFETGGESTSDNGTAEVAPEPLVSESQRTAFKRLFVNFFGMVTTALIKDHKSLRALEKKNNEFYIKVGEIPEATKANYDQVQRNYEKFLTYGQVISEGLDMPLPDVLDEVEEQSKGDSSSSIISSVGPAFGRTDGDSGIWEDEEERMFYESIIDLKDHVPPVLLLSKKRKGSGDEEELNEIDQGTIHENTEPSAHIEVDDGYEVTDSVLDADQGEEDNMESIIKRMHLETTLAEDGAEESGKNEGQTTPGDSSDTLKPGRSFHLTTFVARLDTMTNRDMIDKAAIDFCYINTKHSRKKLIEALLLVPRSRLDLLPYYARLIATLNKRFPEIGDAVVDALQKEFRFYFRQSSKRGIESSPQIRNVIYIGELTKFGVIPDHIIFNTLKLLIENFSAGKVEICCNLVESCGRFLLRNPSSAERMKNTLDIMIRKKGVLHLDNRQQVMIENAYYICNPPDRAAVVKHARVPLEQYIRKLVFVDLSKKDIERVIKQLRKLPWPLETPTIHNEDSVQEGNSDEKSATPRIEQTNAEAVPHGITSDARPLADDRCDGPPESVEKASSELIDTKSDFHGAETATLPMTEKQVYACLLKIFTKVWKMKYSTINLLAMLVQGLSRFHTSIGVHVVDQLLEDIRSGLETNVFQQNQRRIVQVKYLGELYNYRVVNSNVIFDMLYLIITLGHDKGRPVKHRTSPIDSPTDFFRVRLVCTLLETCGMCFDHGKSKHKLDTFITFFQMYVLSKNALPSEVEFVLADTLESLRPRLKRFETYEQALAAVDATGVKKDEKTDTVNHESDGSDSDACDTETLQGPEVSSRQGVGVREEKDEQSLPDKSSNMIELDSESNEDVVLLKRQRELDAADQVADEGFEREFGKLMSDSAESRKLERKTTFDAPIPMRARAVTRQSIANGVSQPAVAFTLLTKRGNKQQMRMIEISSDSPLARNTLSKQEADRQEQKKLKELVLSYEQREYEEARRLPKTIMISRSGAGSLAYQRCGKESGGDYSM